MTLLMELSVLSHFVESQAFFLKLVAKNFIEMSE